MYFDGASQLLSHIWSLNSVRLVSFLCGIGPPFLLVHDSAQENIQRNLTV